MSQRSTALHIPQPCPESWEAMTPNGLGRHCASCQKTVVDFTQKTDAEILTYFQQVGAGRTCGRFQVGQLGRPLRPALPVTRPLHWQLWVAGLLAAALSAQSCQTTTGEIRPTTAWHLVPPPPPQVVSTVDSATVGDIKTLLCDSVTVSAAPDSASQLVDMVLGAPRMR